MTNPAIIERESIEETLVKKERIKEASYLMLDALESYGTHPPAVFEEKRARAITTARGVS